jgi:hypothetical protein
MYFIELEGKPDVQPDPEREQSHLITVTVFKMIDRTRNHQNRDAPAAISSKPNALRLAGMLSRNPLQSLHGAQFAYSGEGAASLAWQRDLRRTAHPPQMQILPSQTVIGLPVCVAVSYRLYGTAAQLGHRADGTSQSERVISLLFPVFRSALFRRIGNSPTPSGDSEFTTSSYRTAVKSESL